MNNKRWADKQMASSLPIKYFHLVFTIPDTLNKIVMANPKEAYGSLFEAASSAILKLCKDKKFLGATPGFTAVLHTWGQTMQFHPHLHVILTAGGLSSDGSRFIDKSDANYLLPVKALAKVFRGIFMESFSRKVSLEPSLKSTLHNTEFYCFLKDGGEGVNVVKYLARYSNRVCISDTRIIRYDKLNRTVSFSYTDNKDGGKQKIMILDVLEFIRRFLLHVLPRGFMKIRHYGLLSNRDKTNRLDKCRRLLGKSFHSHMPPLSQVSIFTCPKCGCVLKKPRHFSANIMKSVILRC
jgi:hypothetical protein